MITTGPSTYKHRAEFTKLASVVTWNTQNLNRKPDSGEPEQDNDSPVAEGECAAGKGKRRRDVVASEAISSLVKSNAFSTSYDWNYRENHLSRTAKKAARISLTTDTLQLITCELEGLDDRYDGSGWTTWKKKDDDKSKKKFNKDGSERKPRQSNPRPPKAPVDPLAVPKSAGSNVPRWFKGVPRCPDLLLSNDEDIRLPADSAVAQGEALAGCPASLCAGVSASDGVAGDSNTGTSSREEKKLMAELELFQKLEQERKSKKSMDDAANPDGVEGTDPGGCGDQHQSNDVICDSKVTAATTSHASASVGPTDDVVQEHECTQSLETEGVDAQAEAQKALPCEAINGEVMCEEAAQQHSGPAQEVAKCATTTTTDLSAENDSESVVDDAGHSVGLLPMPSSSQLAAANLVPSEGDHSFFKLPYMAVRHKFQKDFEDYACIDSTSEFPTPFVPISKNEYVDEEAACRLALHEGKNICQCIYVPGTRETACGEESNCLLRDIYIECGDRCPCGSHCLNKRLRKRQWAKCRCVFREYYALCLLDILV